ncbi:MULTISPECIES: hypothetical protein [unclassified Adlercreutzia]|uniref:hypothetical protein n=1 Tax=unclassified Adlercreutzia TaxID=2636013 RepID=UPI0013EE3E68|nr:MULTISPECIES: hypothetical protein [unclassified Adlercreutzia]
MDANVIVAIIGGISALFGALIGAIPMYLQAKNQAETNQIAMTQNNELILHRLDEIDKKLEKQEKKNDNHDQHSIAIAKLDERIMSCEQRIDWLYHSHE